MLELKYFKELPCRPLNKNKEYVRLAGADLYSDKDGNRYAFLSFQNLYKSPFFSLYLYIKEYDSSGTFLKDSKFSVPNFYGKTGLHVINEPVELEKECSGIEVYIYFAEFIGYNFYNDQFVKPGQENVDLGLDTLKNTVKAANNSQSGPIEQPQPQVQTQQARPQEAPVAQSTETPNYEEEEHGEEQQQAATPVGQIPNTNSVVKKKAAIFNFVPIIAALIVFAVIMLFNFVILSSVIYNINNGVNGSPYTPSGNNGGGSSYDFDFIRILLTKLFIK